MLKTPFSQADSARSFFILHKPFLAGNGTASFPAIRRRQSFHKKHKNCSVRSTSSNIQAVLNTTEKSIKVKAIVTVGWFMNSDNSDKFFLLELVSAHLDPKTGQEKARIKDSVISFGREEGEEVKYECRFVIPPDFGDVGAISVENEHDKEMFFKNIVLEGFPNGPVNITCNSWVHSKSDNPDKRIFFTNKSYLPSDTPNGLKTLRQEELEILRGTGVGERKTFERIYDYDKYNDLGHPDSSKELARPVLGGKEHPYPRRCRTGRHRSDKDPLSEKKADNEDPLSEKKGDNEDPLAEKKSSGVYVPRDEEFSKVKQQTFTANTVLSFLHALQPSIIESALGIIDNKTFPSFTAIDSLFPEELSLDTPKEGFVQSILQWIREFIKGLLQSILRWDWIWKLIKVGRDYFFRFKTPKMIKRDRFSWFRDDEFSRQTLAGLNPCSIQLVTV
ncbi:hypothetical protein HHK36_019844 [Tetracentron sinense]|uniref:Lipoxygenase n=1 Tax=Tetracentron sinense TaxID=13715 RepID=A0A834YUC5_TETSI|nr:hypothetical protein HHK36_019844 [Tetracentron sinense]